ncbi:MAG: hypothetical protein LUC90_10820 [Lachnospiraceae bacterium]|nr:hypothetical protein [Lachnospiraceae bacterium]
MKRQNRVQINKSAALILALALIMGNLSGCSMWSASEDKYNIPVVEENTLSTSSRINSNQEETSGEDSISSEAAGEESAELSEEETPLDTWEALTLLEENEMFFPAGGGGESDSGYVGITFLSVSAGGKYDRGHLSGG